MASWVNQVIHTTAQDIVEKAIAEAFQEFVLKKTAERVVQRATGNAREIVQQERLEEAQLKETSPEPEENAPEPAEKFCSGGNTMPPRAPRNGQHELPMIFVVAPNGRRIAPPKPKRRLTGTQCPVRRSPPEKSTCPADFNSAPHPEGSTSLPRCTSDPGPVVREPIGVITQDENGCPVSIWSRCVGNPFLSQEWSNF